MLRTSECGLLRDLRNGRNLARIEAIVGGIECRSQEVHKAPDAEYQGESCDAPQGVIAPLLCVLTSAIDDPNDDADDNP